MLSSQGEQELRVLRQMGASRQEAVKIVTNYEASRKDNRVLNSDTPFHDYEPVLCYEKGGKLIPVDSTYGVRTKELESLQKRAGERIKQLERSRREITALQGGVESEHEKYTSELRRKITEVHAAVEQREVELLARLEKTRTVKMSSLASDLEECEQLEGSIQSIVDSIEIVVEDTEDPDTFVDRVGVPKEALEQLLVRDDRWVPDVRISESAKLECAEVLQHIAALTFEEPPPAPPAHPSLPQYQGPMMAAFQAHASAMESAAKFASDVEHREENIAILESELEIKRGALKAAAVKEDFGEALQLKDEVNRLEMELHRTQLLPHKAHVQSPEQQPNE